MAVWCGVGWSALRSVCVFFGPRFFFSEPTSPVRPKTTPTPRPPTGQQQGGQAQPTPPHHGNGDGAGPPKPQTLARRYVRRSNHPPIRLVTAPRGPTSLTAPSTPSWVPNPPPPVIPQPTHPSTHPCNATSTHLPSPPNHIQPFSCWAWAGARLATATKPTKAHAAAFTSGVVHSLSIATIDG